MAWYSTSCEFNAALWAVAREGLYVLYVNRSTTTGVWLVMKNVPLDMLESTILPPLTSEFGRRASFQLLSTVSMERSTLSR